jgi:membrane-associated phospholipid phosphatase
VSRRSAVAGLAAAYAALAVAVATGALNGVDQWAIDHVMPGVGISSAEPTLVEAAVPLLHAGWGTWLHVVANVVTLPAQGLVSLAILLVLRDLRRLAAWLGVDAVELLCKQVIVRPPLYHDGVHLVAFDSSFPSGHTLRSLVVAAAVAAAWPRARWAVAAWAASSLLLLELAGHHVPSDIAGGVVLAGFVLGALAPLPRGGGAARALRARGLRAATRRGGG